jgi:hypothetical protein
MSIRRPSVGALADASRQLCDPDAFGGARRIVATPSNLTVVGARIALDPADAQSPTPAFALGASVSLARVDAAGGDGRPGASSRGCGGRGGARSRSGVSAEYLEAVSSAGIRM